MDWPRPGPGRESPSGPRRRRPRGDSLLDPVRLIAGALARLIFPGRQGIGIIWTILLGVGGALIGGLIASALGAGDVDGFDFWSFLVAVGGALLLLFLYEALTGRRGARA